ncbi:MAG: CHAT domain-containing protein, partial [Pseudonocardiaceae bacterium]
MFRDREKDRQHLGWLWDTVAGPVLTSLGHASPPGPDMAWPRIWWCPTGPLTVLPLHAAGHHPRHQRSDNPASADTVPDRVISSYTPTLTALLRAHTASTPTGPPRLLAIGMPTTPGAGDLQAIPAELDRIHARCRITTRLQSPIRHRLGQGLSTDSGTQPTTATVLAELPHHAWVHLSCHGSQHVTDPTESAFWLTDGPLRITDLIEQHDPGPRELAFLSACQTAAGSPRAFDEAIHLAAAMQLLGYRHVIATLWSIYDSTAPDVADTFYSTLTATG